MTAAIEARGVFAFCRFSPEALNSTVPLEEIILLLCFPPSSPEFWGFLAAQQFIFKEQAKEMYLLLHLQSVLKSGALDT